MRNSYEGLKLFWGRKQGKTEIKARKGKEKKQGRARQVRKGKVKREEEEKGGERRGREGKEEGLWYKNAILCFKISL